jgi:hypothetical protein
MGKTSTRIHWSGQSSFCEFHVSFETERPSETFQSRIYVDTRLHYMLELSFNEPFFTRGDFPSVVQNGTQPIVLQNPWANGTNASPFDQRKL